MQPEKLTKPVLDFKVGPNKKLSTISEIRKEIKKKVKEDLSRFRTCCADPRASK